jgi:hypothetical protein
MHAFDRQMEEEIHAKSVMEKFIFSAREREKAQAQAPTHKTLSTQ